MALKKRSFGVTADGRELFLYTLENSKGMKAEITNYGANLVNLFVPDAKGQVADVVLGYDDVEGYKDNAACFGATIGPNANRIGQAKFAIDGTEVALCRGGGSFKVEREFRDITADGDKGSVKDRISLDAERAKLSMNVLTMLTSMKTMYPALNETTGTTGT